MSSPYTVSTGERTFPDLLFRCCSNQSAGRLLCGQLSSEPVGNTDPNTDLAAEFLAHIDLPNTQPTRLISTTTSLLRVLHLAFQKLNAGETGIEIIFISPEGSTEGSPLHGPVLASNAGMHHTEAVHYQSEYLWPWRIPEACVLTRVDLDVLESRGFTLQALLGPLQSPPSNLSEFSMALKGRWAVTGIVERSIAFAAAACRFGYYAPVPCIFWGLLENSIKKGVKWGHYREDIEEILEDAMCSLAEDVCDRSLAFETDLADLSWECAELHHNHAEKLDQLIYPLLQDEPALDSQLREENNAYQHSREHLQRCIRDIYVEIGLQSTLENR
ncbi:hypothetical protein CLAFUW4_09809 [Fulvia fulva]|uniref:DUF7587 domain-containing protein n=1 Tax=Passalora fulva TaxID=5499 RepID=A0A9Q8UUK9_PASFU|nr:uncharacterized protein CLAFUR5_12429 [Fulvia fulva]KAK4615708.1 hypothetical protein CLAFUR4_09815 [Fulvia fulva]KAK4616431.1 hypothetical protein CLAFUR0_09808 [Fulvia fulva]UJO23064.1 hypothetical protein CLAFUR5_12429 [Fulvia fulva]WPV19342.1 hypothetical protein CLAFUW4_09809 [Fulvia fulva]WPV33876.1 hypothetical protein CLAFUW7_09812 [Fulvia fulva]